MPDLPDLRRLAPALIVSFALLAAAALAPAAAADPPDCSQPAPDERAGAAAAVVCEINVVRRSHGAGRLRMQAQLSQAGRRHAHDMVRRGFFSHTSPGGSSMVDRARAAGYLDDGTGWALGEVLAWGTRRASTPAATVAAWMKSPSHRRVLLNRRYRDVGIGVAPGRPMGGPAEPGTTYAAELGDASG